MTHETKPVYMVAVRGGTGYLVVDKYGVTGVNPFMRRATMFMTEKQAEKYMWPGDELLTVDLVVWTDEAA